MKAIRIHEYGGPEVLRYENAPIPEPGPGEVLLKVHAAAVNPVDWMVSSGFMNKPLPYIPGCDMAGVVERDSGEWKKGDEVFCYVHFTRDGTYAEYVAAPAGSVARKPKSLDFIQAASLPVAAITPWQAMFDTAQLSAGQTVVIHGGAGGVGSMAVQLAKAKGARVIATASGRNIDFVKSLGADEVIDYKTEKFEEKVKNADVVLDTVGGDTQKASASVLRKGGFLVSLNAPPPPELLAEYGIKGKNIGAQPNGAELAEIAALVDAGKVKTLVEKTFPLAEARKAWELGKSGQSRGKIVLLVS